VLPDLKKPPHPNRVVPRGTQPNEHTTRGGLFFGWILRPSSFFGGFSFVTFFWSGFQVQVVLPSSLTLALVLPLRACPSFETFFHQDRSVLGSVECGPVTTSPGAATPKWGDLHPQAVPTSTLSKTAAVPLVRTFSPPIYRLDEGTFRTSGKPSFPRIREKGDPHQGDLSGGLPFSSLSPP